jgi:hypothetical protein
MFNHGSDADTVVSVPGLPMQHAPCQNTPHCAVFEKAHERLNGACHSIKHRLRNLNGLVPMSAGSG